MQWGEAEGREAYLTAIMARTKTGEKACHAGEVVKGLEGCSN